MKLSHYEGTHQVLTVVKIERWHHDKTPSKRRR